MDSSIRQWHTFVDNCLAQRIRPDQFEALSRKLLARSPISGRFLAELLARPRDPGGILMDPLLPIYLDILISHSKINAGDALKAAFGWSHDRSADLTQATGKRAKWQNPLEFDEILFNRLTRVVTAGNSPSSPKEAVQMLQILAHWMQAVVMKHNVDSMLQGLHANPSWQMQSALAREAFSLLVMSVLNSPRIAGVISSTHFPKGTHKLLSQALTAFVPFMMSSGMEAPATRLDELQKLYGLTEDPSTDLGSGLQELDVANIQLQAVQDLPVVNTRAGLYIFLNGLLVARPLTDDTLIINYLNMRYKGDIQSLTIDLILASFDILSNGLYRNEGRDTMFVLRSFLVNKIPILLSILSTSMFTPITPEFCITQALSQVDPNAFPSFSQSFDMNSQSNALADVRQDFLFACALHRLIPVDSIERLLGEPPMAGLPESGKYVKENLVARCSAHPEQLDEIMEGLERMDGNAGAIAGAVTEVMRILCNNKDSMALKNICNFLSRRPKSLDVMLQYTSPASILQPICQFLDSWQYDDDQGEYQPIYDEFGAILLLVLAIVHRYNLTYHEIGVGGDSFIAQLLERGHRSIPIEDLTADQSRQLEGWIKGLFNPKGTEAVSDDLMASCRPQEFYLLVSTILEQVVTACSSSVLSLDTVKSGLEYMLETFLLPSLVGAVTWMTSYLQIQTHKDHTAAMQILHKIMIPTSMSGDAQAMHGTMLSIVGSKVERCIQNLVRRNPTQQELNPVLDRVKGINYERTPYASSHELERWTNQPGNTFHLSIRGMVRDLTIWSAHAAINLSPPTYSHKLLYTSMKINSARETLLAILEEVKDQTGEAGNGSVALDVGTSLICAPSVENSPAPIEWMNSIISQSPSPRTGWNLRDFLKYELDNVAAEKVKDDPLMAETIVRLHRRVENQLAITAPGGGGMGADDLTTAAAQAAMMGVTQEGANGLGMNMDDDATTAAVNAAAGSLGGDPLQNVDLGADPSTGTTGLEGLGIGNLDMPDMSGATGGGAQDQNGQGQPQHSGGAAGMEGLEGMGLDGMDGFGDDQGNNMGDTFASMGGDDLNMDDVFGEVGGLGDYGDFDFVNT